MVKVADARNIGQAPSLRDPGVSVPDFGATVGRVLDRAGAQLTAYAKEEERKAEEVKRKEQQISDLQFETEYRTRLQDETSAAIEGLNVPLEDPAYTERVREATTQVRNRVLSDLRGQFTPSDLALARAQSYGSSFGTGKIVVARSDSNRARLESVVSNAGDYVVSVANGVTSDPQSLLDALEEQGEYVSTLNETIKSDSTRAALLKAGRGAAVFNHLTAQVKDGAFGSAERALDSGEYNDALTPAQVRGLRSAIQSERNRIAEAQRAAAKDAVDGLQEVLRRGQTPDYDDARAAVSRVSDPTTRAAFERQVQAVQSEEKFLVTLGGASPAYGASVLESLRQGFAQGGWTEQESDRFAAAEAFVQQATEAQEEDAIQFRVERNEMPPAPAGVPQDPSNPVYSQWTILRANEAAEIYKRDPEANILHGDTRTFVQEGLSSPDAARRAQSLAYLQQLSPLARQHVLGQMGSELKPAIRVAISMTGNNPKLARTILEGQRLIDEGAAGITMARQADVDQAIRSLYPTDLPFPGGLKRDVAQAVNAYHATIGFTAEPDSDAIKDALQVIFAPERVADVNGTSVLWTEPLYGTDQSQYDDMVDYLIGRPQLTSDAVVALGPDGTPMVGEFEALEDGAGVEVGLDELEGSRLYQNPVGPTLYAPLVDGQDGVEGFLTVRLKDGRRGRLALDLDLLKQAAFNKSTFFEEVPPEGERVEMLAGKPQDRVSEANRAAQRRVEENYKASQERLGARFAPANEAIVEFLDRVGSGEGDVRAQMEADLRRYEEAEARGTLEGSRAQARVEQQYGSIDQLRRALEESE